MSTVLHSAIFEKDNTVFYSWTGLSARAYQGHIDNMAGSAMKLTHVSGYEGSNGDTAFAAVFVINGMSAADRAKVRISYICIQL